MPPAGPPTMYEMAYAVHTKTCTYLLDEDGVCRWVVSPQGLVPSHIKQAIGAQFVACLDLAVDGGLVGELRSGAMALFVQHATDRMVLLRTAPIQHVDDRRGLSGGALPGPLRMDDKVQQYGKRQGIPASSRPTFGVVHSAGEEQTITVTMAMRRRS